MRVLLFIAAWYALASLITFVVYAWDKRAARRDGWRTRERTLLLCDAAGGWPGGLVAQRTLRHKNRKVSYQVKYWLIVVVHLAIAAVAGWLALR